MGLSTGALVGVITGISVGCCFIAAGVALLLCRLGMCDEDIATNETVQLGGIPLDSKVPKLTDEEKEIKETALRRYRRRLRREAQQQRRAERDEQAQKEEDSVKDVADAVETESTVSADTAVTTSTVASTVVYGRGAYNRQSSVLAESARSLPMNAAWHAGDDDVGAAARRRRQSAQRRRRRARVKAEQQGGGAAYKQEEELTVSDGDLDGWTSSDDTSDPDWGSDFLSSHCPTADTSRRVSTGHHPPDMEAPPAPRRPAGAATRNLAISGFFAPNRTAMAPPADGNV